MGVVTLSVNQILLFIFCLIAGVLAFVGFFTFQTGYPFSVIVQVLILVFAILGCVGAWLAHRILLFFTAIGFIVVACLTVISLIICIAQTCGLAGYIINAILLGLYIAIIILSVFLRGRSLRW
eukprot:TRINITY_DN1751_c0_g1_i1.p1 TRINITY_DN1751_c0_g1~~TRINITY_DN1751_c0_g1_i1.p1  ORF type:complete len:134 (-),score=16.55 TRINITY_DN1751_c0_g1_i1:135-503(-)